MEMDGYHGQSLRLMPPLNGQQAFLEGFPYQPPMPPPGPPPVARDEASDIHHFQGVQIQHAEGNNWSKFLGPGHGLQFQRVLGYDVDGVAYLAKDVSTGIHYAVKALDRSMPDDISLRRQTDMRQVSAHPNLVSPPSHLDSRDYPYLIMEYRPERDPFANIPEKSRYVGDDIAAKNAFLQILEAVSHRPRQGLYHSDITAEPQAGLASLIQPNKADMSQPRPPLQSHPNPHAPFARGLTNHRYFCTHEGCDKTFRRYGDLRRHFRKHFICSRAFHCHHLGCHRNGDNGFYRKDKFVDHQRKKHGL
jgi:hypothetical protein